MARRTTFEQVVKGVRQAVLTSMGCRFVFDLPAPTHAVLLVEPHSSETERVVTAQLTCCPDVESHAFVDHFANRCRRLSMPAGEVEIEYAAIVAIGDEPDPADESAAQLAPSDLPSHALPFLLPSRYCESDLLADQAWDLFGHTVPGWHRVQEIVDWVHGEIEFDYARSSTSHTAMSVLQGKIGVCRDYTHVAIALCRAFNIPARYVFGYLPDIDVPDPGLPMDFCAWMEVQLGGRWYTFDVRNNQRRKGRVVIGRGRDAADVAMVTSYGRAPLLQMEVTAEPIAHTALARTDAMSS
jgi:transglutaminase-like putative cysteine protease